MQILLIFLFLVSLVATLFQLSPFPQSQSTFSMLIGSYALTCLFFSSACYWFLPLKFKIKPLGALTFLFVFNFTLPFIGFFGTLLAILYPIYKPKISNEVTWLASEKIDLPDKPNNFSMYQYSSGSLQGILLHDNDLTKRQAVVQAARHLPAKSSVPLFKIAISDPSDDVRLLAFSALESIETRINQNLLECKASLLAKPTQMEAFNIAQQYWELCYLGIASSALRQLYLNNAKEYLEQAESIAPTASAKLLLGRVFTAQGEPKKAIELFFDALAGGLNIKQVAPYLAEAAFDAKHYQVMKQYLAYLPDKSGDRFSQVKAYWS